MSEIPTPGQLCYEAWFQAAGLRRIVPWAQLPPCGQAAWEAAAQAVLAHTIPRAFKRRPPSIRGQQPGMMRSCTKASMDTTKRCFASSRKR